MSRAGEISVSPLLTDLYQVTQGRHLPSPTLQAVRAHASWQLERLPERSLDAAASAYPVEIAPALRLLAAEVDRATQCSPSSFSSAVT